MKRTFWTFAVICAIIALLGINHNLDIIFSTVWVCITILCTIIALNIDNYKNL